MLLIALPLQSHHTYSLTQRDTAIARLANILLPLARSFGAPALVIRVERVAVGAQVVRSSPHFLIPAVGGVAVIRNDIVFRGKASATKPPAHMLNLLIVSDQRFLTIIAKRAAALRHCEQRTLQ